MENIWTDPDYSRTAIESAYHKLTDKQWEILQAEVDGSDDENPDSVIHDVCMNIDSYEQEHDLWNARLASKDN
jgi:hypothetical protein